MIASTSKGKAAAILATVFAAGGLTGAAVIEVLHEEPAPVERERRDGRDGRQDGRGRFGQSEGFLRFLTTRLELTEEQQNTIRGILVRNEKEARELWNGIRADLEAGVEQTRSEIREALTPEQVEKFDAALTEERGRRRGGSPRGRDGPPPAGPPPPERPSGGAPMDREGAGPTDEGSRHGPATPGGEPVVGGGQRLGPIARV